MKWEVSEQLANHSDQLVWLWDKSLTRRAEEEVGREKETAAANGVEVAAV